MKRFKNILYVAESRGVVHAAFHHAVALAQRNQARLTVIVVMEQIPDYLTRLTPRMFLKAQTKEFQAALDSLCDWVAGRVTVEARIVIGKPFLEIVREVLRNRHDLVIKPATGDLGIVEQVFGTTDMHLLRKCPCPVWLINSAEPTPIKRVMACVDFNDLDPSGADSAEPLNRMILEMSGSLACLEHSDYHVVHAWEPVGEHLFGDDNAGLGEEAFGAYVNDVRTAHRHWLDQLLQKARTWIGAETYDDVQPTTHLPKGGPGKVIPKLARELGIDIVVMGTVARTGIPGFFIGNTAESILVDLECSVLAVKPPGFVSPVTLQS